VACQVAEFAGSELRDIDSPQSDICGKPGNVALCPTYAAEREKAQAKSIVFALTAQILEFVATRNNRWMRCEKCFRTRRFRSVSTVNENLSTFYGVI
jgi:hypothetical protein